MRDSIQSEKGAPPQGPYSHAIIADGPQVYVSGQGPLDPETGKRVDGSFAEQAEQVFKNVEAILQSAGTSWANAVKVTIYLSNLGYFKEMNEIYSRYVSEPYPARSTVQAHLGKSDIVVDCIAVLPPA